MTHELHNWRDAAALVGKPAEKRLPRLPRKLHQLLRLAISDIKATRRAGIGIDMGAWVASGERDSEPCTVCLAGAVMLCERPDLLQGLTLADPFRHELPSPERRGHIALNQLRQGHIEDGVRNFYDLQGDSKSARLTRLREAAKGSRLMGLDFHGIDVRLVEAVSQFLNEDAAFTKFVRQMQQINRILERLDL